MAVSIPAAPLPTGQKVTVRLPHVGALPATVDASGTGVLVLVLAVPDARVLRLVGGEADVECTTARGIQRFSGTLLPDSRADLLRVALAGDCERIQRREWVRVDAVVPVHVKVLDEPALGGDTVTLNLSGGGVLLRDPWHLPLGLDVRLALVLPESEAPVGALGRVVREVAADQKGVRIDDMGRDDEERLVRFVRERERAALKMASGR
jgi:c-di-GMP-binding flagellar brake protein YcgR